MLAIISRKHYSKYKGIKKVLYAMSDYIFSIIRKKINTDRLQHEIRKLQIVSDKNVKNMSENFIKKLFHCCLALQAQGWFMQAMCFTGMITTDR